MTLFITANDNERVALLAKLENQTTKTFDGGVVCKYGIFGKYEVAHYHSPEQGNAAELRILRAVEVVNPTYVILVGVACGGNSDKQKIGDVLVSHNVIDYDCRKEDYKIKSAIWRGVRVPSGDTIYGLFNGHYFDWQTKSNLKAYLGDIISSSVLLNNPVKKSKIFATFNDEPIGYEMEGIGAFRACRYAKITEWILVKGVCDFGDGNKGKNKQENQEIAANNAVLLCHYIFSQDGVIPNSSFHDVDRDKQKVLLPPNNLPPRNENFTGRLNKLEELDSEFSHSQALTIRQIIAGLGGVGKTQLSIEYAYHYYKNYSKIIWFIVAEDKNTIYKYFLSFAHKLNIVDADYSPTTRELQNLISNWLQQNTDWLIILDNMEKESDIEPYLPGNYGGNILITTRNRNFKYGKSLDLYVFSEEEALEFLGKQLNVEKELLKTLSIRLGYFPLALKQAVAYILRCGKGVKEYLDLLESNGITEVFQRKPSAATDYKKIVATTWDISFKKLSKSAMQLFNLCAYLAADNIPVEIFLDSYECISSPLCDNLNSKLDLNDIIAELYGYSLIEFSKDELSIHRLVQEVLREHLTNDTSYLLSCLRIVKKYLPLDYHPSNNLFKNFSLITEHAKTVIEYAEKTITDKINKSAICEICYVMAERYRNMSEYKVSQYWCEKTLSIFCEIGEENSKAVAEAYCQTGLVYAELNMLDESLSMLNQAKKININNNEQTEVASTLVCIAYIHSKKNEPQIAINLLHEARKLFEHSTEADILDTAACYSNLGRAYKELGDYKNSLVWLHKAVEIRDSKLGEHTDTAASNYSLAETYFLLKEYDKAYKYNTKSLKTRFKLFGEEYTNTKCSIELAKKIHIKIDENSFKQWLEDILDKIEPKES